MDLSCFKVATKRDDCLGARRYGLDFFADFPQIVSNGQNIRHCREQQVHASMTDKIHWKSRTVVAWWRGVCGGHLEALGQSEMEYSTEVGTSPVLLVTMSGRQFEEQSTRG